MCYNTNPAADFLGVTGMIKTVDFYLSPGWFHNTGENLYQGSLAGSIGTKNDEGFPVAYLKINASQSQTIIIRLG
jgi:hypothetical protein